MRKYIYILLLLLSTTSYAQNISIKSFKALPNDLTARIDAPKTDINDDQCAIIKVVTTETGFVWDIGQLAIVDVVKKVGEYWLYVPYGTKAITIKHNKLGVLRNYAFGEPIKQACVYELVLTTGKVTTVVEDVKIITQWLMITSQPSGADVYINEKLAGTTPFQRKYKVGEYNYRLELSRYNNIVGVVNLKDEKKKLEYRFIPKFGNVNVTSLPESGMNIFLNGKSTGQQTPAIIKKVDSGEQTIKLQSKWYQSKVKKAIVSDEKTTDLKFTLEPAFAEITITAKPEADIFIDETKEGIGAYNGRLLEGIYTIKAEKDKYTSQEKQLEIIAGKTEAIDFNLKGKTGSVDIITTPMEVSITIDGKDYGTSPNTIENLLIGNYDLILKKEGFETIKKEIIIEENDIITVNEIIKIDIPLDNEIALDSISLKNINYRDDGIGIRVKYFRALPNDLTARMEAPKTDMNDDQCAIIKVVTTETGFVWDIGHLSIVDVVKKVGEYWLYVPYGTKAITIKHNKLGVLRNYAFGEPIKQACVYEMVLITGSVIEIIKEKQITINSKPSGAILFIDGLYVGITPYSCILKNGTHKITLKYLGNEISEDIVIANDSKTNWNFDVDILEEEEEEEGFISIQENNKYITIKTAPSLLGLYIDGEFIALTPYTCKLKRGEYKIEIRENGESLFETKIEKLNHGKKEWKFKFKKTTNYIQKDRKKVTIRSNPLSMSVFIDGIYAGTTPYTTSLKHGKYKIKLSRLEKVIKKTINIKKDGKSIWTFNSGKAGKVNRKKLFDELHFKSLSIGAMFGNKAPIGGLDIHAKFGKDKDIGIYMGFGLLYIDGPIYSLVEGVNYFFNDYLYVGLAYVQYRDLNSYSLSRYEPSGKFKNNFGCALIGLDIEIDDSMEIPIELGITTNISFVFNIGVRYKFSSIYD